MIELLVIYPDQQEVIHTFEHNDVSIGRKEGLNDLVLSASAVSSQHARIYQEGDVVWVEDLGSTNGTLVNARRVDARVPITTADTVVIARFKLRLWQIVDPTYQGEKDEPLEPTPTPGSDWDDEPFKHLVVPPLGAVGKPPEDSGELLIEPHTRFGVAAPVAPAMPTHRPPVPRSIEETGLKRGTLIDLVLKTIYFAGEISGYGLADEIKLPFNTVVEPIINELRRDKYLDVKGGGGSFGSISMIFSVTGKATELVRQVLDRNRYTGPAPVSMEDYSRIVGEQSVRRLKVPKRRLVREFSHLVLNEEVCDNLGPAINSGTAILLYGPPGNGKTIICQAMINCFDDYVFVPYAIEADGNIIKVYDEHNHRAVAHERSVGDDSDFDPRYVLCHRPLIMVGGELTLDMLDMSYSSDARYYEAPFQMKANGGILLIDDFGRQKVSPRDLLNRWIVPLESEVDFIALVTGKKLRVPFDVFVAFATNLDPAELVDDAFLRRVRYKQEISRPSREQFRQIFKQACTAARLPWSDEGFDYLLHLYDRDGRPVNACEPRNLLDGILSLSDYLECKPELKPELLERAYRSYFTHSRKEPG